MYDVVIVGAGPAGSACGRRCADAGLKALIVEKAALPRPKNCSGFLTEEAESFIERRFGRLPDDCLSSSGGYDGIALHVPGLSGLRFRAVKPAANVRRDRFDFFLAGRSGCELRERSTFVRAAEENGGVRITVRSADGRESELRSRWLVGCDGGNSRVVRGLAPRAYRGVPWAFAYQKYYRGSVELEDGWFHAFFERGLGIYSWLTFKDEQILIGCCCMLGDRIAPYHGRLLEHLRRRWRLEVGREELTQGCLGNGMSPLGRFFLGRGRILCAGEAAGFLHMGGEGISCALETGHAAGAAICQAAGSGADALAVYRAGVKGEMRRAVDQWDLVRMFSSATHRLRTAETLLGLSPAAGLRLLRGLWRFADQEGRGSGLGRAMLLNTLGRPRPR